MKERLKMIFDRIDIFVVCIVIGLCFCIVEAFLGIWNMFADCFFITPCYRMLLHPSLQGEASNRADRDKGEAEGGREECK